MADPYQYFRRLFRNDVSLASGQILAARTIELPAEELASYQQWRESDTADQIFRWICAQFTEFSGKKQTSDDGIDFFNRTSESGMLIHAGHTDYDFPDFLYLFLFFKEMLRNYEVKAGDVTVSHGGHMVETRFTYHLEAIPNDHQVLLQVLKKDEFPVQFRLDITGTDQENAGELLQNLMDVVAGCQSLKTGDG